MGKAILVFDTETTGAQVFDDFSRPQSKPMQFFGAIYTPPDDLSQWFERTDRELLILNTMKPIVEVNIRIQVGDEVKVEEAAVAIHGISRDEANRYGISEDNAAHLISDLLDIADVAVAHNIDFDRRIINHFLYDVKSVEFPSASLSRGAFDDIEQFCTMKTMTNVCKIPGRNGGYKWPKLIEAYRHFFGRDFEGDAHDARADSIACAQLYFAYEYFRQLNMIK